MAQTSDLARPASDDALREQIRSVVGWAIDEGRPDAYIDQLMNEAAAEGKLFVPEDMRTLDGRVDTSKMLAFLEESVPEAPAVDDTVVDTASTQLLQPTQQAPALPTPPIAPAEETVTAEVVPDSQLLQPGEGAQSAQAIATGAQLGQAPAASEAATGSQLLQPGASEGAAVATGTQLLQPGSEDAGAGDVVADVAPADEVATGSQLLQPGASDTAVTGSQILQPTSEAAETTVVTGTQLLQPTGSESVDTPLPVPETPETDDVATVTAAQLLQPSEGAEAAATGAQPLQPSADAGSAVALAATAASADAEANTDTAAASGGQVFQPAPDPEGGDGTQDSTDLAAIEADANTEASDGDAEAADPEEVALADPEDAADPEPEAEREFYTVRRGDSLSTIAAQLYGDPFRFEEIFDANRNLLRNPNLIVEGQRLFIPR
ncbi:MAG: LysM peptidoglycan-binding domain-containing protein [Pseudomonadota bacterium]